jgi:hypothetical protein
MVDFNDKDWHMTDPTSRQRGRSKRDKTVTLEKKISGQKSQIWARHQDILTDWPSVAMWLWQHEHVITTQWHWSLRNLQNVIRHTMAPRCRYPHSNVCPTHMGSAESGPNILLRTVRVLTCQDNGRAVRLHRQGWKVSQANSVLGTTQHNLHLSPSRHFWDLLLCCSLVRGYQRFHLQGKRHISS